MIKLRFLIVVTLMVLAKESARTNAQGVLGKLLTPDQGCGISDKIIRPRIVGGINAKPGAFPWMALIGYGPIKGFHSFYCGGSLITSRHVLTAAHCVDEELSFVRLGEHIQQTDDDGPVEDIPVIKITKHQYYDTPRHANDIAVLTLARDVTFSDRIRPVCLPLSESVRSLNFTGYNSFVAGWGNTQEKGRFSKTLQQVELPVLSNADCEAEYESQNRLWHSSQFRSSVICAGLKEGGKDSCQGDSGGPLMVPLFENGKFPIYQIGVVSYGVGCARAHAPGVYSSTQYYLDWIKNVI